jgi:hypothetical protein
LRALYEKALGHLPDQTESGAWMLREQEKQDVKEIRTLFEALAGSYMGRGHRRVAPHNWMMKHLADSNGQVFPRSFLTCIRFAAADSLEKYLDYPYPLHYDSIKRGIKAAADIRVQELSQNYYWVPKILNPLENLDAPYEYVSIDNRWSEAFPRGIETLSNKEGGLPPQSAKDDWAGIRKELKSLGVFEVLEDGHINIPEIYRIGFNLRNKDR